MSLRRTLTASLERMRIYLELQHPLFCTQLSADLWSSVHAAEFGTADLINRYAVERPPRQPTLTGVWSNVAPAQTYIRLRHIGQDKSQRQAAVRLSGFG